MVADPLLPIHHAGRFGLELVSGHNDFVQGEGMQFLRSVPQFEMTRWIVAVSFIHSGQPDQALELLEEPSREEVPTIAGRSCDFMKFALRGERDEALACLDQDLLARARNVEWWSWWMGECYAFIGEEDLAIDWLENAFERGFINYPYLSKHSKIFRRLDDNTRFQTLLARVRTAWEQLEP